MAIFPSILEGITNLEVGHVKSLLQRTNDLKNGHPARLPLRKSLSVATSFLEHSTRTKFSFAMAIKKLGGHHIDFLAESSSLKKGESLEQTLLTLHYQGIDICIIRTNESHLLSQFREFPPIKIINGGDGINQHPTQALLDLYTMTEYFGGMSKLKNKTIAIVGDCVHSRVTHSLIDLLPMFDINVVLCGPEYFIPPVSHPRISSTNSLNEALEKADILYMLRIQNERHSEEVQKKIANYKSDFGITLELLQKTNKLIPVFHPGPANIGIEVDEEIVNSELWFAHEQVKNSVYMRMAIIEAMITNNDSKIGAKFNKVPGACGDLARKT